MKVNLTLNGSKVEQLKKHLGEDRVVIVGEPDQHGYTAVTFEVNNDWDVLCVLHAGCDDGLALGLYGPSRKAA